VNWRKKDLKAKRKKEKERDQEKKKEKKHAENRKRKEEERNINFSKDRTAQNANAVIGHVVDFQQSTTSPQKSPAWAQKHVAVHVAVPVAVHVAVPVGKGTDRAAKNAFKLKHEANKMPSQWHKSNSKAKFNSDSKLDLEFDFDSAATTSHLQVSAQHTGGKGHQHKNHNKRIAGMPSVVQCVRPLLQCVAVCCSVLQESQQTYLAVCCSAVCCSVLQCVAVCCSVLQCVAV